MILAVGVDPSRALVLSQVVLSFGIPFALIPLGAADRQSRAHGRRRQPPGHHRPGLDGRRGVIIVLNVVLIYLTVAGYTD